MPLVNRNDLEIALDEVDSPGLLVPPVTNVLGTALDTLTGKVLSQTKTTVTEYAEKKAKKMSIRLFKWLKWKLSPPSNAEVSRKASSFLLTDLFYITKKALRKHISEDKKVEFNNIFENLWAKNFRKIALEAYKEEQEQEELKEKIIEINKCLNQNLKSKNKNNVVLASRVTKDKLLKDIIKILKKLKTNKIAQEIVKEWKEIKKISEYDFLKVETTYYRLYRNKKTKLENKIVNLNLDELIFTDKVIKLADIFKKDNKINEFLRENLNASERDSENVMEQIKGEIQHKTEKWKIRVNAESSFLQFDVNQLHQNISSNNSQDSGRGSRSTSEQSDNLSSTSEILEEELDLLEETQEQERAYKERLLEIEKQEQIEKLGRNKYLASGGSVFG